MRSKYWSNGKFADFVRGTPSLECGTGEEWRNWHNTAKTNHPIRFWIVEELFDKVQNFIMCPIDKLYSIKYWFLNRFVTKTHALTSNLKKGQWYEMDYRIINCLFDELINYVEQDLAWKNIICDKEAARKYNAPWYALGWFRTRTWRSPEAGLSYLDWETTLIQDESWGLSKDDPEYGKKTPQAETAEKVSRLYHWWKFERPNRPDPYEVSGFNTIFDSDIKEDFWDWASRTENEEERDKRTKSSNMIDEIGKQYQDEDTEMLIELIKIRRNLWT
jgi:hypothetical protein